MRVRKFSFGFALIHGKGFRMKSFVGLCFPVNGPFMFLLFLFPF